jgi:hypothetical protein
MRGRELCGRVWRLNHEEYGQCVEVRVTGTPSALSDFEEFLQTGEAELHWEFEKSLPEPKRIMPSQYSFQIIPS